MQLISSQLVSPGDQIAEVTTYQGAMSLRIYAMGFLELATVAARATLDHRTATDAITPSIIYAIRHATELFLKHIIEELKESCLARESYRLVVNVPNSKGVMEEAQTGHHILQRLWNDHRSAIVDALNYEAEHSEHANFDRSAWFVEFDGIINQLHRVDPDGQTLRYPIDKKDAPNLGGKMLVSVAQLEQFARHATECFSRFSERDC